MTTCEVHEIVRKLFMNKYVTRFFYGGTAENNAGPKAKNDINFFLGRKGFTNVDIHLDQNKFLKLLKTGNQLKKQINLKANGFFLLQYPLNSKWISNRILKLVINSDHFISACVIHDLESLRMLSSDDKYKSSEVKYLNNFNFLVVHNAAMKEWLSRNGITSKMYVLNLFDYFNPCAIVDDFQYDVVYAGNLIKAKFLSDLKLKNHTMTVFGINQLENYPENIFYNGSFSPEELPSHLNSRFGLIWDGDSIEECSGLYGHYLKYNTPHKISLYLSSGIPVIIWRESEMSEFVKKNKLGVSICNLNSLDEKLSSISEDEYSQMRNNALKIADKLKNGYFMNKCLNDMFKSQEMNSNRMDDK